MGLTMLRIDRSKLKWRAKLENAFDPKVSTTDGKKKNVGGKSGKWTLFLIPMITVLREGLEAVVFVGGVSLLVSCRAEDVADFSSSGISRTTCYLDPYRYYRWYCLWSHRRLYVHLTFVVLSRCD